MLRQFETQKNYLVKAGCKINRHGWSFTKNGEKHNLIRLQDGWRLGDKEFPFFLDAIKEIR